MRLSRRLTLALLAVALAAAASVTLASSGPAPARRVPADPNPEGFKQIAAPPAEFLDGRLRLPDPARLGTRSGHALLPLRLDPAAAGQEGGAWTASVPVDTDEALQWALLPPAGHDWALTLTPPGRAPLRLGAASLPAGVRHTASRLGMGETTYPAQVYAFQTAQPTGLWQVQVTGPSDPAGAAPTGVLALASASPYRLYSYIDRLGLVAGQGAGLVAYLYDQRAEAAATGAPAPLAVAIDSARGELRRVDAGPGEDAIELALTADAQGVLRGEIPGLAPGRYTVQVVVSGVTPEGQPFLRTVEHLVPVVPASLTLTGHAQAAPQDDVRLRVDLAVDGDPAADAVRASAEVWGAGQDGSPVPVAWISGLAAPIRDGGGLRVSLALDGHWIALAGAAAPFELRQVRLQDRDHFVPLSVVERIPLAVTALPDSAHQRVAAPTAEMLMGARPDWLPAAPEAGNQPMAGSVNHRLMLVHGYCSSDVWGGPLSNGQFSQAVKFQDLGQNRSHDQFARLINAFGWANLKSYGIVAHSQGGAAALHLYNTYWSGLDWVDFDVADGSRLIQSLGTPYQGTALAGNLALLGQIFGAGCGSNTDLTYTGAAAWLSTVPAAARSQVSYYVTGENSIWPWDSCTAADLLLDDPNDGVTEAAYATLVGGNNKGYTDKQCHVTGAPFPAQYLDAGRNAAMNAAAKR